MNKEQYIHRLGRTARAGGEGQGIIVLADYEEFFLKKIADLAVKKHDPLGALPHEDVRKAISALDMEDIAKAYSAFIGYNRGALNAGKSLNTQDVVNIANHWAMNHLKYTGSQGLPPPIEKKLINKMGLARINGYVHFPYDVTPSNVHSSDSTSSATFTRNREVVHKPEEANHRLEEANLKALVDRAWLRASFDPAFANPHLLLITLRSLYVC